MNYSRKYSITLILSMILVGCTANRAGMMDQDSDEDEGLEVDIWVDLPADAPEDELEETLADIPVDTFSDAHDGPVEPETPCGGPDDDCDGDGYTPLAGDCCDSDPRVHPGVEGWFEEPYLCPDEEWDYDCSGHIEYEQSGIGMGVDASVPPDCVLSMGYCDGAEGWEGGIECGETGTYVECFWYESTSYDRCEVVDPEVWTGTVRCR